MNRTPTPQRPRRRGLDGGCDFLLSPALDAKEAAPIWAPTSNTGVVMLTARESRADLEAARRAGVDAYVVAPISPVMLKHRLARLVGAHQAVAWA